MMMTTKSATESDNINKIDLGNLVNNDNEPSSMIINNSKIRICVHICEKKKRQCKFNAIKNSDYCVEHLAFNQQVNFFFIMWWCLLFLFYILYGFFFYLLNWIEKKRENKTNICFCIKNNKNQLI